MILTVKGGFYYNAGNEETNMLEVFFNELIGAVIQLLIFALIPFIWWLITARKKESFFKWIGLKRIRTEKKYFYHPADNGSDGGSVHTPDLSLYKPDFR